VVSLVNRPAPLPGRISCGASHPGARFAHPRLCLFGPSGAFGLADHAPYQEAGGDVPVENLLLIGDLCPLGGLGPGGATENSPG
jgi:hypothetical protein